MFDLFETGFDQEMGWMGNTVALVRGYNIRSNVSICCTAMSRHLPLRTGIDENNLVAQIPGEI